MAKLSRVTQKIFGSSAGANQIGKFGSFAAGAPVYTTDPSVIQSLSNYLTGWFGAILGSNSPAIEDMNAICFLYAYQLAYLMQAGIAEYDASTTYYIGSMVNSSGRIYVSLTDNNLGNSLTSTANWKVHQNGSRTVTTNTTLTSSDEIVRSNGTSGNLTHTLPAIASSIGQRITIKDVGSGTYTTTIQANGSETIDGNTIYSTALGQYDSITVFNNGTTWDVL